MIRPEMEYESLLCVLCLMLYECVTEGDSKYVRILKLWMTCLPLLRVNTNM